MWVIPAIDMKDGKCVRLRQGRMDEATVFSDSPVAVAEHWMSLGAERLHVVDLDGAFAGKPVHDEAVKAIVESAAGMTIQVGGGIRTLDAAEAYLQLGVDYIIIGTQAVKEPDFVDAACRQFPGKIMVGLDAVNGQVAVQGWAELSEQPVTELAKRFEQSGISAIIYTDILRDGMMGGVNLEATAALARAVSIPVIASGGVSQLSDIEALMPLTADGVAGVITGRAIYEGGLDLQAALALVLAAS
ncbi:MAG: 1-(5-phosphoribosyl)-5-[(5-phosphoribosylamino)methylideneamino]imidazole-4-carboxamide isomerase [Gammaproteobacteria bacterium]